MISSAAGGPEAGATGEANAALDGVRVLDLAGPSGAYCGRLLAGLGAEVIRIEPPDGDASRRVAPFYPIDGRPAGPSVFDWHFNAGKLGVTLNLPRPEGQEIFRRLASTSAIVVEAFRPGYLRGIGLDYESLSSANQALIVTSITPFGQSGPYSQFDGDELIVQAAGGLLWMCGWPDRAPVMMGGWPAMHQASAEAAAASLLALLEAEQTGEGRHIDVSAQACMPMTLMTSMFDFYYTKARRQPRIGNHQPRPLNGMFACKDGYLDFRFRGRPGQWDRLVAWLNASGMAEDLGDERWRDHAFRDEPENTRHINDVVQRILTTLSREEAMDVGQRTGYEIGAVYNAEDLLADPQLEARGFWVDVEHDELNRTIRYPGGPFVLSETPWRLDKRAPLLGEHNEFVYCGFLGLTRTEFESLRDRGVF
jgi:benzylsuccinate CoA-transferase BbsE subunit